MIYLLINKKGGDGSGSTGLQMYVTSYMCSSAQWSSASESENTAFWMLFILSSARVL